MSKAKTIDWREASPAPVLFVSGPEDFLASRVIRSVRAQMREIDESLEVHELSAAEYTAGQLLNLTSPSLFGEPRLIVISNAEKCTDELIEEGIEYLASPTEDTCVIIRHNGSSVRGKKLIEAMRASQFVAEVPCLEIKKDAERAAFVQAEFKTANRQITSGAVRALIDAFADDLAELSAACTQLLQDSSEQITESTVERYYGGRIETNAFKVADAAFAGQAGQALALLRHALATGADPVPMVAALSMKVRQLAKLMHNRSASPQSVGMAPWQLDRARKDLVGWSEEGLAEAIKAIASADAAAKGAERDPVFALERLVQLLAAKGDFSSVKN